MKTLFESILDIDDLEQSIDDASKYDKLKLCFAALRSNNSYQFNIRKNILTITTNICDRGFNSGRIYGEKLHELGIDELRFNINGYYDVFLFNGDLISFKITSNRPVIGCGAGNISSSTYNFKDIELNAPLIDFYSNRSNRKLMKNIKIKTNLLNIYSDITPGINKLNKIGFGKFTTTNLSLINPDYYDYDSNAINNITLKDILTDIFIEVQANYIIIIPAKLGITHACYIIINPNCVSYFKNLKRGGHLWPIETLKDGWLITQYSGSIDELKQILSK